MLALLTLLGTASAADVTPTFDGRLSLAYWRLGTQANIKPGVSIAMPWADPDNVILAPAALKLEAEVAGSPAFVRAGGRVTFSPLAVLDITPYGYYDRYFGNFQTIVGYDSWDANYGYNDDIEAYVGQTGAQAPGAGYHYGVSTTLKAQVGNVIVLLNGDWSDWNVSAPELAADYDYFFERELEVMMRMGHAGGDNLVQGNGVLLYHWDKDEDDRWYMRVGSLTQYRMTTTADDRLLRTGALVQVSTRDETLTHTVLAQAYLRDRAYEKALPPFLAYQVKWTPALGD